MNINDLDAVPTFDADLNAKKIGDCGTCNSDIYDNYTKCTKCDAFICPDCKEEDWCKSCEEAHEKLKDEDDSKVCTWCSENTDTLHTCKACECYLCLDCLYGGMCANCFENFKSEKRAKNAAAKN